MLGPTWLAEDTPHFLRAAGLLPAVMLLPAVGLAQLWQWPRLPAPARQGLVAAICLGSLALTVRDYTTYSRQPVVAMYFEAAATGMARQIRAESADTAVYLDRWFWDEATQKGWPSLPFLANLTNVRLYRPETGVPPPAEGQAVSLYAWPYGDLSFVPGLMPAWTVITVSDGPLARGDLESTPYPLFVRYHAQEPPARWPLAVNFGGQMQLRQASVTVVDAHTMAVDLYWAAAAVVTPELTAFVHIEGPGGVLAQSDTPPANGRWQPAWWQPGQIIHEQRTISLSRPLDPATDQVTVGLYNARTLERLPVLGEDGREIGIDDWGLTIDD
jgi:hypothetical protein